MPVGVSDGGRTEDASLNTGAVPKEHSRLGVGVAASKEDQLVLTFTGPVEVE